MRRMRRTLAAAAVVAALLAVFAAYTRPALVITLANQLWSCF